MRVNTMNEDPTPVRFAILGAARIAQKVAPGIQACPGSELVAVASRSQEKAQQFASRHGNIRTHVGYQAALDDPNVDAVYIPLPPSLHLEWTVKAAAAGKHVLCEKPLGRTVCEVDEMMRACRQNHVVLMDGVQWYHSNRAAVIREILNNGILGELNHISAAFTFRWDEWKMEDFRMYRESGGGSLLDLGWYCVGAALLGFREIPQQVFACATYHNDVDTHLNGILSFRDGRTASINCGFDTVKRRWVEFAGTRQALVCDDFTRPWNEPRPRFWIHNADGKSTERVCPDRTQEERMVEAFCQLIHNNNVNHEWGQLARQTQQVCDALDKSARTGTMIALNNPD